MKIIQLVPLLLYGDAIGNDIMALDRVIRKMGYKSEIWAGDISDKLKGRAKKISVLSRVREDDIIIYHLAVASQVSKLFSRVSARKIIIFHNITPSRFFKEYSRGLHETCEKGIEEAGALAEVVQYCLADSSFNKMELINLGYKCPIDVLPILIPFKEYAGKPDMQIVERYRDDGYTNLIFVGRVAPNKKFEDVIAAFCAYQKLFNSRSRLFLVGDYSGMEAYHSRLVRYADEIGAENVIFSGHIPFDAVLAYYRIADVFLCMSEHEGFCVPLVESMYFDIPIIAYDRCAVGETMGDSGIVIDEKDPVEIAALVNRLVTDDELKEAVVAGQRKRLEYFDHDRVEGLFMDYLNRFIDG